MAASPPSSDEAKIAITFIDVLFAVVAGRFFLAFAADNPSLSNWDRYRVLAIAAVMIVLSYVGYHKGPNRPAGELEFYNAKFFQFGIDLIVIGLYFATVVYGASVKAAQNDSNSPLPEAALVSAVFFLYILWDLLAWRIRGRKYRRGALVGTVFGFLVAAVVLWATWCLQIKDSVRVDIALLLLLIIYRPLQQRLAKSQTTAPDTAPTPGVPAPEPPAAPTAP